MNILITGVNSFEGSNLVTALKDYYILYGLDNITPKKYGIQRSFTWSELDSIPPVDVINHLAGKAHDTKNQTDAQVYFDINTGLTKKIYDWFLASEAKKFVFFSSVKAAADRVEGDILTEEIIPSPKGPYGESKIAAENYILSRQSVDSSNESVVNSNNQYVDISRESKANDQFPFLLPTTNYSLPTNSYPLKATYILRPCMIHGPGNKGNLNLLYQVVKKGIPYPLGAFENRRSFTSVDNLCFVIAQLIDKDIPGGIYNMGDDESLSTNELIALMCKTMDKPNRIWNWNKPLVKLCARAGTVLHLPLNTERLQKLTENYVVSNAKLKKALEIDKMPVTAEEGFVKTIESFEESL